MKKNGLRFAASVMVGGMQRVGKPMLFPHCKPIFRGMSYHSRSQKKQHLGESLTQERIIQNNDVAWHCGLLLLTPAVFCGSITGLVGPVVAGGWWLVAGGWWLNGLKDAQRITHPGQVVLGQFTGIAFQPCSAIVQPCSTLPPSITLTSDSLHRLSSFTLRP
ncbi:hypothetical protein F5144DRAFT_180684 [Chaetomium tenue]|uniref:Uncharacterized protein n=1 Tax=Chaetomium tenue TaxID=1854479 RepID=A0ACB7PBI4_9PEZI|nr:hypothetical protein F5144DRAFT_180684 [Chaetomium globosum]